jgi:hypothetical protein
MMLAVPVTDIHISRCFITNNGDYKIMLRVERVPGNRLGRKHFQTGPRAGQRSSSGVFRLRRIPSFQARREPVIYAVDLDDMRGFARGVITRVNGRIAVNVVESLIDFFLDVKKIRRQFEYRQRLIQISLAVDYLVKSADKVALVPLLINGLVARRPVRLGIHISNKLVISVNNV